MPKYSKTCARCNQQKDISEFYRNRAMSDGRTKWCKKCTIDRREELRQHRKKISSEISEALDKNPKYRKVRRQVTVYLPPGLIKYTKIRAIETDKQMSDITESALIAYL